MKMSRRDRKMFNQGKQVGYLEGYAKGLHDGNPFNGIIEALSEMARVTTEAIANHPELLEEIRRQKAEEMEDENDTERLG